MTDGETTRLRDAADVFGKAACKCKEGSDKWITFMAFSMICRWLLDDPFYRDEFEQLLRATKSELGALDGAPDPKYLGDPSRN